MRSKLVFIKQEDGDSEIHPLDFLLSSDSTPLDPRPLPFNTLGPGHTAQSPLPYDTKFPLKTIATGALEWLSQLSVYLPHRS